MSEWRPFEPSREAVESAGWSCPAYSNECSIRRECINKCGMRDSRPVYAAVVEANRRAQREVAVSLGLRLKSDDRKP